MGEARARIEESGGCGRDPAALAARIRVRGENNGRSREESGDDFRDHRRWADGRGNGRRDRGDRALYAGKRFQAYRSVERTSRFGGGRYAGDLSISGRPFREGPGAAEGTRRRSAHRRSRDKSY